MKNSNEKPKLPNDACLIETPGRRQFSVVDEYGVFFLLSFLCPADARPGWQTGALLKGQRSTTG